MPTAGINQVVHDEDLHPECSLLSASPAQESRVQRGFCDHAGAWDWREHGDFSVVYGVLLAPQALKKLAEYIPARGAEGRSHDRIAFRVRVK
jgi:hypothetical protein